MSDMSDLLRPLLETIEIVRPRIQTAGGWKEAQTRASLIDPILTALGWDVADPALVRHEFSSHGGRADYALLASEEELAAIVEAKALGNSLETKQIGQTATYANMLGAPYAVLTDGNRWVLYEVFKKAKIEDRLILDVSVSVTETQATALALLALWRPNVLSSDWRKPHDPNTFPIASPSAGPTPNAVPNPAPSPTDGWIPLPDFQGQTFVPPPSPALLPDGSKLPLKFWKDLIRGVVRWLLEGGTLSAERIPVPLGPNSTQYLVNTEPHHQNGKVMDEAQQIGHVWVQTFGNQDTIRKNTSWILKYCGEDPRKLQLRAKP